MSVSQTMETEEDLLTCLHIKLYHPQQSRMGLYSLLPLEGRSRLPADEPLRLGRDSQACALTLVDTRVSRKQVALHAYRTRNSPDLLFTIQNLSQRGQLAVNGVRLGFLEKTELPDKALIRFGEYQMLVCREPGEARATFEVQLEVLEVSPFRDTGLCAPTMTPVVDTGSPLIESFSDPHPRERGPLECDETLLCL